MVFVLVCLCGAAGAVSRFSIDAMFRARWAATFPWATVLINVTGSLLLGLLTGLLLHHDADKDVALLVGTGFCGGYTTFSTAMFETVQLIRRNAWRHAVANALATVLLTCGAAAIGLVVTA